MRSFFKSVRYALNIRPRTGHTIWGPAWPQYVEL